MLTAIIVDDEPLARENLKCLLVNYADKITIQTECSNAFEAIKAIHHYHPDIVFLDIQMPKINGLEMLSMLDPDHMPYIVFLTAYDEYAIKAFEAQAFDYLLKPIELARFDKTIHRLIHSPIKQDITQLETSQQLKFIPCLGHNKIYLIKPEDVYYINSRASGIAIFTKENNEYFTELTLKTLESKTPLIHCHRQYLINLKQLKEIRFDNNGQAEIILNNNEAVPVSRRYLKSLKEMLGL